MPEERNGRETSNNCAQEAVEVADAATRPKPLMWRRFWTILKGAPGPVGDTFTWLETIWRQVGLRGASACCGVTIVVSVVALAIALWVRPIQEAIGAAICARIGRSQPPTDPPALDEKTREALPEVLQDLGKAMELSGYSPEIAAFEVGVGFCSAPFELRAWSTLDLDEFHGYAVLQRLSGEVLVLPRSQNDQNGKGWFVPASYSEGRVLVWFSRRLGVPSSIPGSPALSNSLRWEYPAIQLKP